MKSYFYQVLEEELSIEELEELVRRLKLKAKIAELKLKIALAEAEIAKLTQPTITWTGGWSGGTYTEPGTGLNK